MLLLGTLLISAGCRPDPAIHIRLNDDVEVPARSVVIFFPDGMDVQRTEELLAEGRLPNIRKRFVEGGVRVKTAMSCLPTVTYPNCSSLITGVFPGHHGILGNFWFERSTLTCRDYMTIPTYRTVNGHLRHDTLYHILSDHFTVSIQNHTRNGVSFAIDREVGFVWSLASGGYWYADRRVANRLNQIADVANLVKRWPTVLMTYYPGVDSVGHIYGTNSPEYATVLENIDVVVGRVTKAFEEAGLADRTYYVLVADHGMVPISPGHDFGLIRWLKKQRGLRVRTTTIPENMDFPTRFKRMEPYDAVATVDAGRVGMIHLKGQHNWLQRPGPPELVAWANSPPALHELPAVEIVAMRDGEDRVRAWSRRGSVTVERSGPLTDEKYRVRTYEGDPLGYRDDPKAGALMDEGWHGSREWLAATMDTRCPDFVPQIIEMFDSPRTGDLVVFAADDWLLYEGEKAGHGSCLSRDIHIPLFFAGPDLPHGGVVPHGRLVDVTPTIVGLLGEADRLNDIEPLDGINLTDQLRQAPPVAMLP